MQRIHPEDREATERKFRDAVAGDVREYSVQYRIVRPSDGETSVDFGQIHHRARREWNGHPPGRRAQRCHRAGDGGAGAAAERGTIPQARRPARRAECDAGAARRGKDPGARPDLERVAGSAAGLRSRRRLANGQSGLDPDAGLERGRIAQPHLGMAGASRRRRHDAGEVQGTRRARNHRQVREPLPPQGRLVPLAVVDRGVRQGPQLCRGPRRHRGEGRGRTAESHRGSAAAVAEDGSGRPVDRRHRPRLQQSADRHRRIARPAADPPQPGADRQCRALHRRGDDIGEPRRGADAPPAGLRAAAAADPEASTSTRWCVAGGSAAPDHRRDHRSRDRAADDLWRHPVRPQPARKCAAQSRHQRARRHAGRRQARPSPPPMRGSTAPPRIRPRFRPATISASPSPIPASA